MTTKPTTEKMREAFEAHILKETPSHALERFSSECSPYFGTPGAYTHSPTEARWRSWQATHRASLREGMEMALSALPSTRGICNASASSYTHGWVAGVEDCDNAIRKLKDET